MTHAERVYFGCSTSAAPERPSGETLQRCNQGNSMWLFASKSNRRKTRLAFAASKMLAIIPSCCPASFTKPRHVGGHDKIARGPVLRALVREPKSETGIHRWSGCRDIDLACLYRSWTQIERQLLADFDNRLRDQNEGAKLPVAVRLPHPKIKVRKRKLFPLHTRID